MGVEINIRMQPIDPAGDAKMLLQGNPGDIRVQNPNVPVLGGKTTDGFRVGIIGHSPLVRHHDEQLVFFPGMVFEQGTEQSTRESSKPGIGFGNQARVVDKFQMVFPGLAGGGEMARCRRLLSRNADCQAQLQPEAATGSSSTWAESCTRTSHSL